MAPLTVQRILPHAMVLTSVLTLPGLLFDEKWNKRKWDGPLQYEDKGSKSVRRSRARSV